MQSKKPKRIAVSEHGNFFDLSWSPDSQWLAFCANADNDNARIMLHKPVSDKTHPLTSDRVESYNPVWSPDGKWLYFLSDRHFESLVRSPWGLRQPEPFFDKTTKIYMAALMKEQRSPFKPTDELFTKIDKNQKNNEQKDSSKKEKTKNKVKVNIDLSGLQTRVLEVPVPPGNYSTLSVNNKRLFWTDRETSIERKRNLMTLDIDNKDVKPKTLVKDIRTYELSLDGKKIMIHKGQSIYVIDASASVPAKLDKNKVNLSTWTFSVDPREEWRQMFVDAWRMERDYFYDRNLHGVDWKGLLEKHLPLVERVADRSELNDLIGQLVGELSALHMSVWGGDQRRGDDQI